MFWSKIWFFLIALGATIALTIALVMPRPAQPSPGVGPPVSMQSTPPKPRAVKWASRPK